MLFSQHCREAGSYRIPLHVLYPLFLRRRRDAGRRRRLDPGRRPRLDVRRRRRLDPGRRPRLDVRRRWRLDLSRPPRLEDRRCRRLEPLRRRRGSSLSRMSCLAAILQYRNFNAFNH